MSAHDSLPITILIGFSIRSGKSSAPNNKHANLIKGVDEMESITLIYPGGRMAVVNNSCSCGKEISASVTGTNGWIRVENEFLFWS